MAQSQTPAECVRAQFGDLPVEVVDTSALVCVRLAKFVDPEAFSRYVEIAKKIGMRFSGRQWCAPTERIEQLCRNVVGRYYRSYYYFPPDRIDAGALRSVACYTLERWRRDPETGRAAREVVDVCLYSCNERGECRVPRGIAVDIARAGNWNLPEFAPQLKLPEGDYFKGLRDYQVEVFRNLAARLKLTGAAVIQMATGAGKSHLAGYVAKWLEDNGYAVFATAMQKDLALQLKDFARRAGARNVVAVTTQYLWRHLGAESGNGDNGEDEDREVLAYADEYSDVEGDELMRLFRQKNVAVIMDEAHHVPARTVRKVMTEAGDGWALRIGLTATPWRNDNRDLEIYAHAGSVIEPRISSSYLIERGYAVPVEIRVVKAPRCPEVVECHELRDARNAAAVYACARRALAECRARNELIAELAARADKPVLVITPLVKHAELLGALMREKGLKAEVVTGVVKAEERKQIYDALRRGAIDAIVATTLADEGLDLPPLKALIIAMAGKSKTRTLQRVGRLVRPWHGKTRGVVYELRDWDDYPYILEHLEERIRLYKTEPHWRVREI